MAIEMRELLKKITETNIVELAGGDGFSNPVTWVHMVESEEIANFLVVGEIIFTTGIALNKKNTLLNICKRGVRKKASGMMVNVGPYIDEIPAEVIDFCNQENFPLMMVPWEVNMANIMRVMTFEISNKSLKELDIEAAIKNAILYPTDTKSYKISIQNHIGNMETEFTCMLLLIEKEGHPLNEDRINKIKYVLKSNIEFMYKKVHVITIHGNIVFVMEEADKSQIESIIKKANILLEEYKKSRETYVYLVGEKEKGVENLSKSYEHAYKILGVKSCYEENVEIIWYDEMGVLKLLVEIDNKEVIGKYYEETVKNIVEYDMYHDADLLFTLDKYLQYDGSLKAVAEELYIHRNTVNYKLNKIAELLSCNLSSQKVRTQLGVGISLYKIHKDIL